VAFQVKLPGRYGLFKPGTVEWQVLDALGWNGPLYQYKLADILKATRNLVRQALRSLQEKGAITTSAIDSVSPKGTVRRQRFTFTTLGLRIVLPKPILLKDATGRMKWGRFVETVWRNYRHLLLRDTASQLGTREESLTIHGPEPQRVSRRHRGLRAEDQLDPARLQLLVESETWTPSSAEVEHIRKRHEG